MGYRSKMRVFTFIILFILSPILRADVDYKKYIEFLKYVEKGGCFNPRLDQIYLDDIYFAFHILYSDNGVGNKTTDRAKLWGSIIDCVDKYGLFHDLDYSQTLNILMIEDDLEVLSYVYQRLGNAQFNRFLERGFSNILILECSKKVYEYLKYKGLKYDDGLFVIPDSDCDIDLYEYYYEKGFLSFYDYYFYKLQRLKKLYF
jgi:hypothetical protein